MGNDLILNAQYLIYMRAEFEKMLKEHSFSYTSNTDGSYILCKNNDTDCIVIAQLILSDPVDEVIQGSRNNNKIQAIGSFKFRLPPQNKNPEFLVMAFQNIGKQCDEFIIIPSKELKRRLIESNRITTESQEIEVVYWLMDDRFLYDCTNVGVEWEWYYLSRGKNGRMADGSVWDYSEFLNDWNRLKLYLLINSKN